MILLLFLDLDLAKHLKPTFDTPGPPTPKLTNSAQDCLKFHDDTPAGGANDHKDTSHTDHMCTPVSSQWSEQLKKQHHSEVSPEVHKEGEGEAY